jgi:hypothetical protein
MRVRYSRSMDPRMPILFRASAQDSGVQPCRTRSERKRSKKASRNGVTARVIVYALYHCSTTCTDPDPVQKSCLIHNLPFRPSQCYSNSPFGIQGFVTWNRWSSPNLQARVFLYVIQCAVVWTVLRPMLVDYLLCLFGGNAPGSPLRLRAPGYSQDFLKAPKEQRIPHSM